MRLLFLTHAFNSLTQRLFVELQQLGHLISVEFDISDQMAIDAVKQFKPDLILAPFLKRRIPETIWRHHLCLVVHPGIRGDRGPSALDWAILREEQQWGVTVLQANGEMDAGDIWACSEFDMPQNTSKASLYHNEITEAAVEAVKLAIQRFQSGTYQPEPLDYSLPQCRGKSRPLIEQQDRAINWQQDSSAAILKKIRSSDGSPGIVSRFFDRDLYLYDGQAEQQQKGKPGQVIGRCQGAICIGTIDGAIWVGHLRDKQAKSPFKLPAARLLASEVQGLPEISQQPHSGYRDIWYREQGEVGYLHFSFYNGAMGTEQCERLRQAYIGARQRQTRIIVLMGGKDYWSNGMHLNLIEASDSPADESWRNINAIDDLAREIINTDSHLTIAAMQGNAGAGGVFLARAADKVWAREGIILNPHYKDMGNLYGSEYWTYLLPRYAGSDHSERIREARLPMGTREAMQLGLVDAAYQTSVADFISETQSRADALLAAGDFEQALDKKRQRRLRDEAEKPLSLYRQQELEKMHLNFYGFDPSYHIARYNFVYKVAKSRTPLTIAVHRRLASKPERVCMSEVNT